MSDTWRPISVRENRVLLIGNIYGALTALAANLKDVIPTEVMPPDSGDPEAAIRVKRPSGIYEIRVEAVPCEDRGCEYPLEHLGPHSYERRDDG